MMLVYWSGNSNCKPEEKQISPVSAYFLVVKEQLFWTEDGKDITTIGNVNGADSIVLGINGILQWKKIKPEIMVFTYVFLHHVPHKSNSALMRSLLCVHIW